MNRRLTVLLLLVIIALLLPLTVEASSIIDSGNCGSSASFTLDEEGMLIITGTGMVYANLFRGIHL